MLGRLRALLAFTAPLSFRPTSNPGSNSFSSGTARTMSEASTCQDFQSPFTRSYRCIASSAPSGQPEIATFASGCFWGTEHIFLKHVKPLLSTRVGYTGGKPDVENPSYRDVCTGATDHAEAVRIEFDPSQIQYADLVEFFYRSHDPTSVNRQGGDVGTRTSAITLCLNESLTSSEYSEYRSEIFTHSPEQFEIAKRVTEEVQARHFTPKGEKIVTKITPAGQWWDAEEYHQLYLDKNPTGYQCPTHRLHW